MEHPDIKTILHYCPETGVFTWMARTSRRVQVGDVAGVKSNGRVAIGIGGVSHYAHRLAWLYMTGAWPAGVVDHMNGDPSDNRWSNLRDVRPAENNANRHKVRTDAGEGHAYPGVLYIGETSPAKGGKRYRNAMHWRVRHHMEGRSVVRHAETLLDAVALKMRLQMGAEAPQRRQRGQPLPRCLKGCPQSEEAPGTAPRISGPWTSSSWGVLNFRDTPDATRGLHKGCPFHDLPVEARAPRRFCSAGGC